MSAGAKLEAEQIKPYTLAGNATVTLVSAATGARFTFKVRKAPERPHSTAPDTWFVKVLAGSDNTADYRYIGYIREGRFIHGAGRSFASKDAPSVIAFAWFARQVLFPSANGTPKVDRLEVWHEGACGRCGRKLTVPESIATGLGPECAGKGGFGALLRTAPPLKKARPSLKELAKSGALATPVHEDIDLGSAVEAALQDMEAEGDRAGTIRDERRKFESRTAMEFHR